MMTEIPDDARREDVTISLRTTELRLAAGRRTQLPVTVSNQGVEAGYFEVTVVGLPSSWVSLPVPPVLYLEAGEEQSFQLALQPPASAASAEERYQGEIRVIRQETDTLVSSRRFQLQVVAYEEQGNLGVLLQTRQVDAAPGSRVQIPLVLINRGEAEFFEVAVRGIPAGWVSVSQPVVELAQGAQKPVTLTVQLPPAPQIDAADYPLRVRFRGQQAPERTAEVAVTLSVAAVQVEGRVGVRMAAVQFAVMPGSSVTVPLQISNQGLETDSFRLAVAGIPTAWVSTRTAVTRLEPGEEEEVSLTIRPPVAPESRAGRHTFTIRVISEEIPDQAAEVECTLTISAFTTYSIALEPGQVARGETAQVEVHNEGNVRQTFTVSLESANDAVLFEIVPPPAVEPEGAAQAGTTAGAGTAPPAAAGEAEGYSQVIQVPPGAQAVVAFQAEPRQRPLVGNPARLPFTAVVQPRKAEAQSVNGLLVSPPLVPTWVLGGLLVVCLALACVAAVFLWQGRSDQMAEATATAAAEGTRVALATREIEATQTIAANLTREAGAGQLDSDGDGLSDAQEIELGTDPNNPDTDADGLSDGQEVLVLRTNPLNPDTDADGLGDGDEVQRGTDPLNPDTDSDQSPDGEEISRGTNPLNPDTDSDRLLDGQESPPCPNPLDPDSDDDGIVDGSDLDPCDPNNPSLTATAVAGQPTATTEAPATEAPPTEAPPTQEPEATPVPTEPAAPTATTPPAGPEIPVPLEGYIAFTSNRQGASQIFAIPDGGSEPAFPIPVGPGSSSWVELSPDGSRIAFTSDRDGNSEIYVADADGTNPVNITNNPANDLYASWSPDGQRIAFASNRDGNQEIYVMRADGSELQNLSNNPANDFAPSWFRSGRSAESITFTSDRDGNWEIYTMNTDGSNQTNLTNNPAQDYFSAGGDAGTLSGSPGIAFTSGRDGNLEIYLMDVDGGNPRNLSNNPANDFYPAWSPDRDQIAFTSDRDGNDEIYVMRADGSQATNLTNNPADDNNPSWR